MTKTTIYLVNTTASKTLNAFCEGNSEKYNFIAVSSRVVEGRVKYFIESTGESISMPAMQNVMYATYFFNNEVKQAVAKRIKFRYHRPQTVYRVLYLDLKTGDVAQFNTMDDLLVYSVQSATAYAEYAYNQEAKEIRERTAEWLTLADELTHGIINRNEWRNNRQACLDKMNLYLSDKDFDAYNAGHLEPRMKSNIHVFRENFNYFDIQFKKGDVTQHEEEREHNIYVTTELETLMNFCHVLTCRRYGIQFEDSVGNAGRVTRESCQGIINYSDLADRINASDDRDYIIAQLQSSAWTVEDAFEFLQLEAEEQDVIPYVEF